MSAAPARVALFPLHAVLFPGARVALRLFEQRYLRMARACLRDEQPFGVCRIVEGAEVGAPAAHEAIGCLARIREWDMPQHGVLSIVASGEQRFRVLDEALDPDGLAQGTLELLEEPADAVPPPELRASVGLLERLLAAPDAPDAGPAQLDSCLWVSAQLVQRLGLPGRFSQRLLACDDALERLALLHRALAEAGVFGRH